LDFLKNYCTFKPLTYEILSSRKEFDCDDSDLNEFFINDSLNYGEELMGKTYCFTLDKDPTIIISAFTVSNESIKVQWLPSSRKNKITRKISNPKRRIKTYPAVLIGRLGVNKQYHHKKIGTELMNWIKAWFIKEDNKTGCRFVVVDAYNVERAINYYKKNGFKFLFNNEDEEKKYQNIKSRKQLNNRLMYFDLIVLKK